MIRKPGALWPDPEASPARSGSSEGKVRQRQACEILKRGHRCGEGVTDIPMSEVKVSVWRVQRGVGVEVESAALGPDCLALTLLNHGLAVC